MKKFEGLSKRETIQIRFEYKRLIKKIRKIYGNKTLTILDIGCGPGIFLELTKNYNWDVIGLDINKKYENRKIIHGDVHKLPFKDNYFDIIVSRSSINYWKNPKKALDEIIRVLKPKSYFFILSLKKPNLFIKKLIVFSDRIISGRNKKEKITGFINKSYSINQIKEIIKGIKNINFKIRLYYFGLYYLLSGEKLK